MCLGIPGQIVSIKDADKQLAVVDVSGIQRDVNVACVVTNDRTIDDCIGDWVLVHGSPGRFDQLKEVALVFAFGLTIAGATDQT